MTSGITCIAGGEVTGRSVGMGTTKLVMDLKRRRALNLDKLNGSAAATAEFFRGYCATDMTLDENILSRSEFGLAVAGKKHWRDTSTNPEADPAFEATPREA